ISSSPEIRPLSSGVTADTTVALDPIGDEPERTTSTTYERRLSAERRHGPVEGSPADPNRGGPGDARTRPAAESAGIPAQHAHRSRDPMTSPRSVRASWLHVRRYARGSGRRHA